VTDPRSVDLIVKLEWAAVALAALIAYWFVGRWWFFALLILAPDLSMLGYLVGKRAGAIAYNLAHILFWPIILLLYGTFVGSRLSLELGLIWLAHIAVDRALGYGLKYATDFRDTHLGRIGRD